MELYGYRLFNRVVYRLDYKLLINISNKKTLRLSRTRARLLEYLLDNAKREYISDDEIIMRVWEDHGLRGSHSLLATSMKEINILFLSMGIDVPFVGRPVKRTFTVDDAAINEVLFKSANDP